MKICFFLNRYDELNGKSSEMGQRAPPDEREISTSSRSKRYFDCLSFSALRNCKSQYGYVRLYAVVHDCM